VVTKETFHVSQKRGRCGERHKLRAPTVAKEPKFSSPIPLRRVPLLRRPNSSMWTVLSASPWTSPTTRGWTPYGSSHRCFWEHRYSVQQRLHPDGGTARPVRVRRVEAAIHLDRAFLTTRAAPRQMYRQGTGGSIVYTGSVQSNHWSRNFRHDGLWPIIRLPRLCFTSAAPLVPSISAIR
jgi:hypothetical protein